MKHRIDFSRILCIMALFALPLLQSCKNAHSGTETQSNMLLMDLVKDYASQAKLNLSDYQQGRHDSLFVSLYFHAKEDSIFVNIIGNSRLLAFYSHSVPPPPPNPTIEIDEEGNKEFLIDSAYRAQPEYKRYIQIQKDWDEECKRLGHDFGHILKGVAFVDNIVIIIFDEKDYSEPFLKESTLKEPKEVLPYLNYKRDQVQSGCFDPKVYIYNLTDEQGHFKFI